MPDDWIGIEAVDWCRGRAPDAGTQLVLFAVAARCDDSGVTCRAGLDAIAADCRCSAKTISRKLQALERAHVIARTSRYDKRDGSRRPDWITLAPDPGADRGAMVPLAVKHPELLAALAPPNGHEGPLGARDLTDRSNPPNRQIGPAYRTLLSRQTLKANNCNNTSMSRPSGDATLPDERLRGNAAIAAAIVAGRLAPDDPIVPRDPAGDPLPYWVLDKRRHEPGAVPPPRPWRARRRQGLDDAGPGA